ncbi:putative alpha/beta superfamily hydrolase [Hypnocyclicus thermotrophus]|uniref:Alpha/beta superfamily hydrolase n=1 Tax=Hypnocyclicus thermotrophus TaxID=1627895 RepID=A0AA46DYE0_9FUSO|nr:alpha/beta hydrolase-fold protein [Hypnocyclicus thermotrophus]TDT69230.1 putative alpha/beta superfamily hydrolase [Hypnocyclicus thermotrophus]
MGKIITEEIYIKQLKKNRKVRIYLPNDYEKSDKKYPVIYMHDAQNIYNIGISAYGMEWNVDKTLDSIFEKTKKGFIVVGIDNASERNGAERITEYSPFINNNLYKITDKYNDGYTLGGKGDKYAEFIVNDLKLYIDKKYKTLSDRENTAIIGSSMGGFISIYIGLKYQNIFSKIGGLSNAIWFAENDMIQFIKNIKKENDMTIYLDVGTNETSDERVDNFNELYINGNKKTYEILKEKGFNVNFYLIEGAKHNEVYWAKRFSNVIEALFFNE